MGGLSNCPGLDDAILVKENHAALAGGVAQAARRAMEAAAAGHHGRGRVRDALRGRRAAPARGAGSPT